MAEGMAANVRAREDWRRVQELIQKEERTLKELQLDYSEKVAVVEALKLELRQTTRDSQDCEQKEMKLAQAAFAGTKRLQELERQWQALQVDRSLLLQQLAAEQDGLKNDNAKVETARLSFEHELEEQRAYLQQLQDTVCMQQKQQQATTVDDVGPGVDADAALAVEAS